MEIKITIKEDLTNVKIADKRKQIINIIHKWLIENNSEKRQEFKEEFLSEKNDKYFEELKERIGEFEEIKKMSVLTFLGNVILGINSEFIVIRELQKDCLKLREDFFKDKK